MATRKGDQAAIDDERAQTAVQLPPALRFLADRQALLRRLALAEILSAPLSRRPRRRPGPGTR